MSLAVWPWPEIMAHRGAGHHAPENTLAALRTGHTLGYRMAEFDVKLSADHVPILLHDDTIDRTSSGAGTASTMPLAQLAQHDFGHWHGKQWAGEPIATLASIAAFCVAHGMHVNIEIKPSTGHEDLTGHTVAAAAHKLWQHAPLPPLLSSFSDVALAAARRGAPHLPRALLIQEQLPSNWQARAAALGCMGIHLEDKLATPTVVNTILTAGYALVVWTVNDASRAQALLQAGCHAVVTDTLKPFA